VTKTTVELDASVDECWPQLQKLETWNDVAGLQNLRDASYDADGNLTGFTFSVDTSLGHIDGTATVKGSKPAMTITGQQKGLMIAITMVLGQAAEGSTATIEATAKATSFIAKPLAKTLNSLLDKGMGAEAAKIAARIHEQPAA